MALKVETPPLTVGFASKLAPTGHFFSVEHVLIPSKLTLVNGYVFLPDIKILLLKLFDAVAGVNASSHSPSIRAGPGSAPYT